MGKRLFDLLVSLAGLLVLSPVLLSIALLIKLRSKGPIFYRGIRIGRFGRPFRIFKFRTMVVDAERLGGSSTSDDDPRITPLGRALRQYKLDELPQLFNVLVGEMSLVGPRPQVAWAVELYSDEQRRLLEVRPGIIDHASIKFRNEGEILRGSLDPDKTYLERIAPEKIRLGLRYVDNPSFRVDLEVLCEWLLCIYRAVAAPRGSHQAADTADGHIQTDV